MGSERPVSFLALLVSLPVSVVLATGAFCLGVDPFGLYRVFPAWAGFNDQKPRQQGHERMVRAADLARLAPDALILGTSRAQVGLDPEAPAWAGVALRPANAAFSDGSPYEALRYLQHADALAPVKVVILGADYLSFIGMGRFAPDFLETRLSVSPRLEAHRFFRFDDVPSTLLSLDTLRISRRTVLEQSTPSYFFDTGRRRPTAMEARIDEQGGARGAFVWSERDYADSYVCARPSRLQSHVADFDALVTYCRKRKIRLVVLWAPSHVRSLALLEEAGLWPELERFKRALAERSEAFELWEFGGADPRSTAEEVPPPGDTTTRTRWYWESSHYRKELGDVVLTRVLGKQVEEAWAGWGEPVTPRTAPRVLARVASELAAWKSAHPRDVAELKRVLAEARVERHCDGSTP
jgi:hypothetical protein